MTVRRVLCALGVLVVLVGVVSGPHPAHAEMTTLNGSVVGVVDGDTLRVKLEGGAVEVVRLRGLDAPESRHPTRPVGCFGPEATARLGVLAAPGAPVELGIEGPERDRFGRLLAYVWRENAMLMLNEQMLAEGYAVVLPDLLTPPFAEQFSHAQEVAQSNRLGLWSACPGGLPDPTDDAPVLDP
jgi:micrococcal nuclease